MKKIDFFTTFLLLFIVQIGSAFAAGNLTNEQKMQEIDSLRVYEIEAEKLKNQSSEERDEKVLKNTDGGSLNAGSSKIDIIENQINTVTRKTVTPFLCDELSEHNCELQEFMHDMKNGESNDFKSTFFSDGKYKVNIAFDNEENFPTKYAGGKEFETVPLKSREALENRIFEHYLGSEYLSYAPELITVYGNVVSIYILVESSNDLLQFLNDERIQAIHHIGNADRDLEEGYH